MNTTDNLYYDWPLVTVIIGGHEPQWVRDVIERVNGLCELKDVDALAMATNYMITIARQEMVRN